MLARIMAGTDPEKVRLVAALIQQRWPIWRVREHLDWLENAKPVRERQPTRVIAPAVAQAEEDSQLQAASAQSSGEIQVVAPSSQSSGEITAMPSTSQSSGEIKVMASSSQSSGEIKCTGEPEHAVLPD